MILAAGPILGELGHIVMDIHEKVRYHFTYSRVQRKVVVCRPEHRFLFELATDFIDIPADLLPQAVATGRSIDPNLRRNPEHPEAQRFGRLLAWSRTQLPGADWLPIPYEGWKIWFYPSIPRRLVARSEVRAKYEGAYLVMACRKRGDIPSRNWDPERWDELAQRAVETWGLPVYSVGTPRDAHFPPGTIPVVADPLDLLEETAGCFNNALLSISSNSGPTHLSLHCGTPTFAWGQGEWLKRKMERSVNTVRARCYFANLGWAPTVDQVWEHLTKQFGRLVGPKVLPLRRGALT